MQVELGKVREFARATKSRNSAYSEGEHPISPVTFLASSIFWQGPETSAWGDEPRNFERILHGEQEFVFHGTPPRAGAKLTGQQRIDKVYEKEGRRGGTMHFIEIVTEFRDESGELVAESRGTSIETSRPPSEG